MAKLLPTNFLEKCSDEERAQVDHWWASLADESRSHVRILLDRRHDSLAYVYAPDETGIGHWHTIPFVDDELPIEDDDDYENEWKIDYFHHLLDHPEKFFSTDVVVRTFHICSQHVSAIAAHRIGRIDSLFQCSARNPNCPIALFMRGFSSAQLVGYTSHSKRSVWLCKQTESKELSDATGARVEAFENERSIARTGDMVSGAQQ